MTDIDAKLQKIALEDWAMFIVMMGKETMLCAKARILRREGKSYRQISIKLGMTESQVRYACSKELMQAC